MSNTRGNPPFVVRLRTEVQDEIRKAAQREGVQIAQWVEKAVRLALDRPPAAGGGDGGGEALDAILERLAALETAVVELRSTRPSPVKLAPVPNLSSPTPATGITARRLPKGGRSLNPEEIAEVLELRRQGMSQGAIAKRFGVSQSGISNVIQRNSR